MTRFSIGDVDKPTHAAIVKGFHKYTRAAISPEESISGDNINIALHWLVMGGGKQFFFSINSIKDA